MYTPKNRDKKIMSCEAFSEDHREGHSGHCSSLRQFSSTGLGLCFFEDVKITSKQLQLLSSQVFESFTEPISNRDRK